MTGARTVREPMLADDPYLAHDTELTERCAGAVVLRDLPAGVVAAGTPARVVRSLDAGA